MSSSISKSIFLLTTILGILALTRQISSFEISDPTPDLEEQMEEAEETEEERKLLDDLEKDIQKDSGLFEGLIRPDKKRILENSPLPLRVEARILGRDVMNFIRWRRPDIASKKLANLEKILPDADETHYLRGALHFTYGRWEEAEKELMEAVAIHPLHDPALFLLGCTYAMQRNWKEALDYIDRSIYNAPYSPYYRMNLAYLHFLLDDNESAYRQIQTALKQKSNFDNAFVLAKHMGYDDWDEEYSRIRFISKETKEYLANGFPDEESKILYVMKRFYTFYPTVGQ